MVSDVLAGKCDAVTNSLTQGLDNTTLDRGEVNEALTENDLFEGVMDNLQNVKMTCGCEGLADDLESWDKDCKQVISKVEEIKKAIRNGKSIPATDQIMAGQISIGNVCISDLQIVSINGALDPAKYEVKGGGILFKNVMELVVTDSKDRVSKVELLRKYLFEEVKKEEETRNEEEEVPVNASFAITGAQLKQIFPDTDQSRCNEVAALINKYSDQYEINTPLRMAHFIGQIGAETKLKDLSELSYSKIGLLTSSKTRTLRSHNGKKVLKYCALFEGYFAQNTNQCPFPYCDHDIIVPEGEYYLVDGIAYANKSYMQKGVLTPKPEYYTGNPDNMKFFDYVYACQLGNGSVDSKDGSRFRGRGFLQLTGHYNYKTMVQEKWDKVHGKGTRDFMCRSAECDRNLEMISNDLDFSMLISMTFWKASKINTFVNDIENNTIEKVTEEINGGQIGINNRKFYTRKAYETIK